VYQFFFYYYKNKTMNWAHWSSDSKNNNWAHWSTATTLLISPIKHSGGCCKLPSLVQTFVKKKQSLVQTPSSKKSNNSMYTSIFSPGTFGWQIQKLTSWMDISLYNEKIFIFVSNNLMTKNSYLEINKYIGVSGFKL
jgi:hypothetical protein